MLRLLRGKGQSSWPTKPGHGSDALLADSFGILRTKWGEVPGGERTRVASENLLDLSEHEFLQEWQEIFDDSSIGKAFSTRGWYQLIYKDVFSGKKIVDFGCGLGIDTIYFAQCGAEVTFVDLVPTNLEVVKRLCKLKGLTSARFCYMEDLSSLSGLPADYDFIYCLGSLHHSPLEVTRLEAQALLKHLPVGGRWIQLAYPKWRWVRDGRKRFTDWGRKTDGGAPWTEWHDLDKVKSFLAPATFEVVLTREFHNSDFNWFDLVRRT
jgi:2-polyprenyl-3-methyl-5-hydroxy-6-metoxy-1,4-benzoquinol methylase